MSDQQILVIAGTIIMALFGLVVWFAQYNYMRIERALSREGEARSSMLERMLIGQRDEANARTAMVERMLSAIAEESKQRAQEYRAATSLSADVDRRVNQLELDMARNYVSFDRLTEMLEPMTRAIVEVEKVQEKILDKLDKKADRRSSD